MDPTELDRARQARLDDIARLGDLSADQIDYLARAHEDNDVDAELGCDVDTPKLTDDEWAYVIEVNR